MSLDATRAEAARVAAHVDLGDIRLWGLQADLNSVPNEESSRLSYHFEADVEVQMQPGASFLVVFGSFSLHLDAVSADAIDDVDENGADAPEDDESDEASVAVISFNLNALFSVDVEPDEPFTESELKAFGNTTGQFALYPYARELVASITGRMGLPPLHLGVMRLNLESREG